MLQNFWYACEFSHAVTDQPKQIELWNQKIVLYRDVSGSVVALKDVCPHRGAALSLGKVEGNCIQCPYHGWKFQPDGACTTIPSNPLHVPIPRKAKIPVYSVQEKYGFIWLFWGDLSIENQPPLPTMPDFSDPAFRTIYVERKANAHYSRVIENLIDPVHAAFLHANSFGGGIAKALPSITKAKVVMDDFGASLSVDVPQPVSRFWKLVYGEKKRTTNISLRFCLPNVTFFSVDSHFRMRQSYAVIPVNDNTTIIKTIYSRTLFNFPWADGFIRKITIQTFLEDKPTLESQRPSVVPNDLAAEIHVAGDAMTVAYRKLRKKSMEMKYAVESSSFSTQHLMESVSTSE
ncbi:aromatic ring-hydroxylating dioxygenase subunit alpha [Leptothoe spongobia]|uniref:Aromatic ring-hydroxylating dioxygenase subunit alpha n=1 Tax=Leptothoe spongobia TAU-MAC 1115 TaxID=1967444 RepID=A0A947DB76_9CYAN|nr:aromatic ring-hydroxylating dioxygenase subunit alpha [Leptothoe spongobia]MBT9314070.1 aromatic ring-hydroxylating dioxygenase subunit alpha [Leptothoe spongobia TAU-MAC 1115]